MSTLALSAVSNDAHPGWFSPIGDRAGELASHGGYIHRRAGEVSAVVGTLDSIYTSLARQEAGDTGGGEPFDFWAAIAEAAATVPGEPGRGEESAA